jgi:hypothetical protein
MDGYAGFCHRQTYPLTHHKWDDGSGAVTTEMLHASKAERVSFDTKQ